MWHDRFSLSLFICDADLQTPTVFTGVLKPFKQLLAGQHGVPDDLLVPPSQFRVPHASNVRLELPDTKLPPGITLRLAGVDITSSSAPRPGGIASSESTVVFAIRGVGALHAALLYALSFMVSDQDRRYA